MKKNDWKLMGVIVVFALVFFIWNTYFVHKEGSEVTITVKGKEFGTYSLNKEQTIKINDGNTLRIKDGKAKMVEADCPDKLCMHQKAIDREKETIVCLPNKVAAEVTKGEKGKVDTVAN